MKEILNRLLNTYGPSGREEAVSAAIREAISPYVDEISTDAMGNLIAHRQGNGKKIMLCAHMDQIGFLVRDIEDNGYLRVTSVGGIRREVSLNRRVVFADGLCGILSYETRDYKPDKAGMDDLFIDIGATDRAAANAKVNIGDMAVYAPEMFMLGEDIVAGPAIDDRAGCAVLVETLKQLKNRANDIYAVFSTQEELGFRGARPAAFGIAPDMAIAIDVTMSGDTPRGFRIAVALGKGPCIKIMDDYMVCAPRVVEAMTAAAEKGGIAVQREVLTQGGTDASAIQLNAGGVSAGVLSLACRYVHSGTEAVSLSDMQNGAQLLAVLASSEIGG